jgi:hypothetical protein
MSLKKILHKAIKQKQQISINEVHQIAKDLGYKESTAERTLRESESPQVKTIKNEKGYNIAYRWKNNINEPDYPFERKATQRAEISTTKKIITGSSSLFANNQERPKFNVYE